MLPVIGVVVTRRLALPPLGRKDFRMRQSLGINPHPRLPFALSSRTACSARTAFARGTTVNTATHELVQAGFTRVAAVEAITRLVDSRLLTSEERGGVRRIELTHDILTAVARRSRDSRRQREAAAQRRRRRNRLIGFTCGLALLVAGTSVPLAIWALQERKDAIEQAKIAVAAKNDAVQRS